LKSRSWPSSDPAPPSNPEERGFIETEHLTVFVRGASGENALLRDVAFTVNSRQVTALIGESGAGKTLLAKTISGLLDPGIFDIRGLIRLKGKPVVEWTRLKELRGRTILYAPQNAAASLNPVMKIGKQLLEAAVIPGEEVCQILRRLGLADADRVMRAYPFELSGGENERCLIAMALALRPELLILDEPTAELDAHVQEEMMDLLDDFQKDLDLTLLIITHNLFLVRKMADRIYIIRDGSIVEHGGRETILHAPVHPYTREIVFRALNG
jgi:ABC-type glutathione transport system ATPase component